MSAERLMCLSISDKQWRQDLLCDFCPFNNPKDLEKFIKDMVKARLEIQHG